MYINGAEATRKNLGPAGMYGWFDTFAFQARPEAAAEEVFSLGPANARLKAGKNILALQVHRTESVPAIRAKFGLTVNGVGAMLRSDNSKAKYAKFSFLFPPAKFPSDIFPRNFYLFVIFFDYF